MRIKIQGDIWQPVQVTPRHASFSKLSGEKAREVAVTRLTIVNNVEGLAEITDVKSTNPSFTAEIKVLEPGKKFELIVSTVPPLKQGRNAGQITLSTGIEEKPTLQISVMAFVTAEVEVIPKAFTFYSGRKEPLTRQFFVRNHSKTPIVVSDLKATNEKIQLSLQDTSPSKPGQEKQTGMTYRITVTVPADYEVSPAGDQITFKTDCPTVPELSIPVKQRTTLQRSPIRVSGGARGNLTQLSSEEAKRLTAAKVSRAKRPDSEVQDAVRQDRVLRVDTRKLSHPDADRAGAQGRGAAKQNDAKTAKPETGASLSGATEKPAKVEKAATAKPEGIKSQTPQAPKASDK